jgi:hypothetical protein
MQNDLLKSAYEQAAHHLLCPRLTRSNFSANLASNLEAKDPSEAQQE